VSQLQLINLQKRFGSVLAVEKMDLEIERGELVSLVGPSGCGKTTTLRIVAGLQQADAGRVILEGRDVTTDPPSRRGMGVVFQSYALFPNMTAAENIGYGLVIRRMKPADVKKRVQELVELTELGTAAERYPHQLSGGQQQRVALARALAIEPPVLLLDEPLSALDAAVRLSLRGEIRRIQRSLGIATLYVTHDQEEALSISDRVVVMREGHIEQQGRPEEIYAAPATEYVARFIGSSNRLRVRVRDAQAGIVEWQGRPISTASATSIPNGADALLVVRPERVRVARRRDGDDRPDHQRGKVAERTFLGATTRLAVALDSGILLADLNDEGGEATVDIDDPVWVDFDPLGCRLLPVDGSTAGATT
jgi:putative spermidine/putrescine transport system ATP-binding protein